MQVFRVILLLLSLLSLVPTAAEIRAVDGTLLPVDPPAVEHRISLRQPLPADLFVVHLYVPTELLITTSLDGVQVVQELSQGEVALVLPTRELPAGHLRLNASAPLHLLGHRTQPHDQPLDLEAVTIYRPPSPDHPIGLAWPIRAIFADQDHEVRRAANDLASALRIMYGHDLPINPSRTPLAASHANTILIGRNSALAAGLNAKLLHGLAPDSFLLQGDERRVIIAGGSPMASANGAYAWLRRHGADFCSGHGRRIPRDLSGPLHAGKDVVGPAFRLRRLPADPRFLGWDDAVVGDPRVGARSLGEETFYDSTLWLDHTAAFLVPPAAYAAEHPEFYALRGDSRQTEGLPSKQVMLCLSNREAQRTAAKRLMAWMQAQPECRYFVISQGDSDAWCECSGCAKLGNKADQLLHWANVLAGAVARKFPRNRVVTFAYRGSHLPPEQPPKRLAPNLIILYAAWPDPGSAPDAAGGFETPANQPAREHLLQWLALYPGQIGVADYAFGDRYGFMATASRIAWCHAQGIRDLWLYGRNTLFESTYVYVMTRLLWEPELPLDELIDLHMTSSYGDAAPLVRQAFDLIYDRVSSPAFAGLSVDGGYFPESFYSPDFHGRTITLLNDAINHLRVSQPRAVEELQQTLKAFIRNAFIVSVADETPPPVDQCRVIATNLRAFLEHTWLPERRRAREAGDKALLVEQAERLRATVWQLTGVDIGLAEATDALPPRLSELLHDSVNTIRRYQGQPAAE